MARIVNKPITVTVVSCAPTQFMYLHERHLVKEILDTWVEAGRWWERENETQTWRIRTTKDGVFELTQDQVTKQWKLYKAYD